MLYDPATTPQLKPWLVRTLEPICDAEPGALADYILALLRHNVPESEMRQELAVQLDEFLEKECSGFIDTLFTILRTKSYVPYVAAEDSPPLQITPLDNPDGIPIPLDGLLTPSLDQQRPRKRSNPGNDSDQRPHKGPRLNNEAGFSRFGDDGSRSTGGWMGMHGYTGPQIGGMNPFSVPVNGRQSQGYQPPDQKRGICRDYHNSGYCARGSMCKYSHGDDAVVPGQLYSGALPFLPMFPGALPFMPSTAYDPHEARMDMRPRQHQRAPLLPRIQQEDGSIVHPVRTSGELPVIQDLTPNIPPSVSMPPPEPLPSGDVSMQNPPPMNSSNGVGGFDPIPGLQVMNGHQYPLPNPPFDVDSNPMPSMQPPAQSRGGFRGRGRGGRGTFGGEVHSFRPEKRGDRTLVVEKIPEDKLSLDQVNEWFKRFGTVTNVAIDTVGGKALVSFEKHDEARAAWRSEEAVFGNRFVKVFWHKPMEGHGQVGARMLAASAPLVANMASKERAPSPSPSISMTSAPTTMSAPATSTMASASRKATPTSNAVSALAAKQQQLEQKIAEQKTLMSSLEKASAEEKKDIMAKLRKLGEEMTTLTSSPSSSEVEVSKASSTSRNNSRVEQEKKEKERLDKELEMHHTADETSTTDELKAKLEKLKAEAASLGLDSLLPTATPFTHYRGGYRGRPPRGRGYFRGAPMRGGPPRASMKLDNRPKKLLVKDVSEERVQTMRDWFETTGQLDGIEPVEAGSRAYIVSFKSRSAAEQGLAKGSNIPIVGPVQMSWYTGKESTSSSTSFGASGSAANSAPATTTTTKAPGASANGAARIGSDTGHHSPIHLQEEEVVASGWGGDGDEADGMGLL